MRPEETVDRYFECLREERYVEAAGLMSPTALQRFRKYEADHHRPSPPQSTEDYAERFPDVPAAVRDYWFEQGKRHPPATLSTYFTGIESEEELALLSDQELLARHLEATDHARGARAQIDALIERYPEHGDELRELRGRQGSSWRFRAIGSLILDDLAYVLHGVDPADAWEKYEPVPHVAVVRRFEEGWLLAADPSPFSGSLPMLGQIPVTGPDGETIMLDPYE